MTKTITMSPGRCSLATSMVAVVAVVAIATACERAELEAPARFEPAGVAITLTLPAGFSAAGGPRAAYDKSNRLHMRFDAGGETREQSQVAFSPLAGETRVPIVVRLRRATETMQFQLEVRRDADAVFRGSTTLQLRAGRTTTATVALAPVIAAVDAPDSLPTLTAWGESLRISGVALFITGDTIDGVLLSWSPLDPQIADVDSTGTVVARSDGTARLLIRGGDFTDTARVVVAAAISAIVVSPPGAAIPIGGTRQYTALAFDRRGNLLPDRAVAWTSLDSTIIAIDASGLARGVGVGSTRIVASAAATRGEAQASGSPGQPNADSLVARIIAPGIVVLDARVTANGAVTAAWFEWSAPSQAPTSTLTLRQSVGSGLAPVPVSTTLQGLLPNTLYRVRIVAQSTEGNASDTLSFITPAIAPTVQTGGTTGQTPTQITLLGTVNAHGSATTAWFQWSTDPSFASYDSTAVPSSSGFSPVNVSAAIQPGPPGTTIWYRIVARNQAGTATGATFSFTVTTGCVSQPAVVTEAATGIGTGDMATFNGTVTTGCTAVQVWFEHGIDPSLGTFSATAAQSIPANAGPVPFSQNMFELPLSQTNYYRAVVSNGIVVVRGAIVAFMR